MTVAAAEADERADAAAGVGDEADVAGERVPRVGGAVRIGQRRRIDRRVGAGDDGRDVVARRRFGRHVVEVAAQAGDERQVRHRARHSSCANTATSRRLASGTRTGCATEGGPSWTGAGNTTGAGPRWPSATCPTIDVVVDVVRCVAAAIAIEREARRQQVIRRPARTRPGDRRPASRRAARCPTGCRAGTR